MDGFWQSPQFRHAWVSSLLAGVLFPFLFALLPSQSAGDLGYLARVNDGFLDKALTFAALYFIVQLFFARMLFKRLKRAEDARKDAGET